MPEINIPTNRMRRISNAKEISNHPGDEDNAHYKRERDRAGKRIEEQEYARRDGN